MQPRFHLALPLASATALAAVAPLMAAPPSPQQRDPERAFEALLRRADLDLDGKITPEEFPRSRRAFRRFDRDGDGLLTRADFVRPPASRPAPETKDPAAMDSAAEAQGASATTTAEEIEFFETRVRPVLEASCFSCHSASATRVKGELRLDSSAALLRGGATGPAVVPGDPEASLLVEAIRYDDPIFAMPPREALPGEAVRDLERWVAMGAPWPAESTTDGPDHEVGDELVVEDVAGSPGLDREIDIEEGRTFWSFQPPEASEAPAVLDGAWPFTDVDRYLLAAMEELGVTPVGDADRRTWIRRVTFDLTGLPPTPEEVDAFVRDDSEGAHERVVDRLLASPAFGERFGRHWLDVARYGESSGRETNVLYPHAWRYRDFVIDALNADMPYDEFLRKQIAGDLLDAEGPDERAENLIATGYLALGSKSHNARDPRQFAVDLVDEQIDALSQGVLGVTLSCARCHDHKFDPFPVEDYYALAGIFMSTETHYGTQRRLGNRRPSELIELPADASVPNGPAMDPETRRFLDRARRRLDRALDSAMESPAQVAPSMEGEERAEKRRERARRDQSALFDDLFARFDDSGRATAANRLAMGVADGTPRDIAVLDRGELDRPAGIAARGFPQVLTGPTTPTIGEGSGRKELAEWIAAPEHPLTARVWVNRVWLHLFGTGIVQSPDNFGAGGRAPDHPELLDRLAHDFMVGGWSTKSLVRELVLSHAYRLDSTPHSGRARLDPEVITRWRMPDRRLEAEAIRDSMLAVSGLLEPEPPVGSPTGTLDGALRREELAEYLTRERPVRSVYLPSLRGHVVDALDVFDAPDSAFVCGDREETNVATQALFLMNDEDVIRMADAFADRLLAEEAGERARIERAFDLALGRRPTSREGAAVARFLADFASLAPEATGEPRSRRSRRSRRTPRRDGLEGPKSAEHAAWSAFAQTLFQSAEFRAIG